MPIDHVDTRALSSATGFYANAEDLTQYFSAYYFGNDRLISDESKRRMFRPVWVDEDDRTRGSNYGLGVFLENVGKRKLVGHSGGYQGHITNSLADPDNRIAVSVLTNALGSPVTPLVKTVYKLIDLAKGAQADPEKPATPAGVDLRKFSGRFVSLWSVYDVAVLGGRLYQVFPAELDPAKSAVPLTVIDDHTLRVDGGSGGNQYHEPMIYQFDRDGRVRSVRQSGLFVPISDWKLPRRVKHDYRGGPPAIAAAG